MFWTTGLVLVALSIGQVPAEQVKPIFIEDAIHIASSTGSTRIVSGWEANLGEHPHQVSLRLVDVTGGVSGCGGSVVSRDWVVTAAHCTALRITAVVRAGVVSLTTPQYIFETNEWYNHPSYDDNRPLVVQPNDISMLKLQRPVTYTNYLRPIRIQPTSEAFANYDTEVVYASGWGRTWTLGTQPEVLNWVYLRATSNLACQQLYGSALINANAICAGWYNVTSQSTCQGDSGGPLVHVNSDGEPILVGISSFVAGGDFGCHSGLPAGFIRPGPFHSWITEVTGIDFNNLDEGEHETEPPVIPTTVTPSTTTTTTTTTTPTTTTTTTPTTTTTTTEPSTTTTTSAPTTTTPTTTTTSTTTEAPEESEETEESDEDDSDSEEDSEISELLKKLIVKVKVKVKINNNVKRKVKVKCVDKF